MYKYLIMIEWEDGQVEEIDAADSESEACELITSYRHAVKPKKFKRIWMKF